MRDSVNSKKKNSAKRVPYKAPDNLIASEYTKAKPFVPSYESEGRPCMGQLLANEYQRIWWKEKSAWDINACRDSKPSRVSKILQRRVIKKKLPAMKKSCNKNNENVSTNV